MARLALLLAPLALALAPPKNDLMLRTMRGEAVERCVEIEGRLSLWTGSHRRRGHDA